MNSFVLVTYAIFLLNLIEINGFWLNKNDDYKFSIKDTKIPIAKEESKFFFECNFDSSTVQDEEFTIVGRNFVDITESHRYKPDITSDISIVMTDVTSITKETVDGEFCIIPFEFNGVQNNFCVIDEEIEENDALQCQTNAGLSNCTLGLFMKISTSPRGLSQFITTFQFNEQLTFNSEKFYEFEFSFLYSVDVCENEDLELTVFLFDLEAYEEILYRFNSNDLSIRSDSWNKVISCFQVLSRNYQLQINASSSCTIDQNKAFFAIDNIILREMLDVNQMSGCYHISELPPETTGFSALTQDITTRSTILDSEATTRIITTETSIEDLSTIVATSESPVSSTTTTTTTTTNAGLTTRFSTTSTINTTTSTTTADGVTITTEKTTTKLSITNPPETTNNMTLIIIIGVCVVVVVLIGVTSVGIYLYYRKQKMKVSTAEEIINLE